MYRSGVFKLECQNKDYGSQPSLNINQTMLFLSCFFFLILPYFRSKMDIFKLSGHLGPLSLLKSKKGFFVVVGRW